MRGYQGPVVILAGAMAFGACSSSHHDADATVGISPSESGGNLQVLESVTFGFRIAYPKNWPARRDFRRGHLANDNWKTYAPPGSRGTAVAALVVPGSNHVTEAEMRIGVSRAPEEVRSCSTPPSSVRAGSLDRERIDDADFVKFDAGDAAMNHYLDVHSYRVVHEGACYALDLLVYGVNTLVYDPPPKPPFSREQAFAEMHGVLRSFRFTR